MNLKSCIEDAGGVYLVAQWIDLSPRALYKWIKKDALPHTEFSGTTTYCEIIEKKSKGKVKKETLLKAGRPK